MTKELEKIVGKDARKDVKKGNLEGPLFETSCTATGGGSSDDLTELTGTFECLVVHEKDKDGTFSGYPYKATIAWKTGAMTWQYTG